MQPQPGDYTTSSSRAQSDSNRKAVAKYRQKVKERYNLLEQQRDNDLKRLSSAEAELKRLQVQTRALQVMMEQSKAGKVWLLAPLQEASHIKPQQHQEYGVESWAN